MNKLASVSLVEPIETLATRLGESFEALGFAIVRDHGIPADLIAQAETTMRQFFALPDTVKRKYCFDGIAGSGGYTPFGIETAKDAEIHDLKEFWHVSRKAVEGDAALPEASWPSEVEGFADVHTALYRHFEAVGGRLLQAIALYLGLDRDWFADTVKGGTSVLRLLHYPPVEDAPAGAVRAAPHEDINTITLLLGAEEAGLELLTREGEWLAISPPPGALVVNIGDMLQRLTAGRLRSTTHRVVNPSGERARRSRFSMPFFLHFRPDFLIEPLVEGGETPITAGDYLAERLREIKLA